MKGSLSHELEVSLPADQLWQVYSTLRLAQLSAELLPTVISKVEVEEGDGGVGTLLRVTYALGIPGMKYHKERFVKIDHEKRLKEALFVEGGHLDLGFSSYLIRLEILEKGHNSSVIKSTVEYEVDEEHAANASFATTDPFMIIGGAVSEHLLQKKSNCSIMLL
uniref:Norbelladine synthase n=1 Tax=Narcissus pseudonarcissus TaxID=39639 RepID=NBS_NARPS|nr:RecName: Full=Norbelladine synthase; Short=NpNBS [Narcissus pseudonarcissus]AYV96792.1 norbelladine synthase [Narcissus pseudonarcissus]